MARSVEDSLLSIGLAGPKELGRSLIINPDQDVPAPWSDSPRVIIDHQSLQDPETLDAVRRAWIGRQRTVFEVDAALPDSPSTSNAEVWSLDTDFELVADSILELVARNALDARGGSLRFPLVALALRAGATPDESGGADVLLPDGTPAWCDGGPLTLGIDSGDGAAIICHETLSHGGLAPLRSGPLASELDDSQGAAVLEPSMRSRIIAPAGSGKTRVLTERVRHLIASGISARSLMVVAYNKRAQEEVESRTTDLSGLTIKTLNALSLSVINRSREFADRSRKSETIGEPKVRDLIGQLVTFPRRSNTDPAAAWIDALSAVRLGLSSPSAVEDSFEGDVAGLTELFDRYRDLLASRGQVDFDEQIYLAIEILLREPEVRRAARLTAQVMLVDEFQDLTPAHILLIRLLAGPALQIFGVGDDDQTIYGYSGAKPDWLVEFDHFVPSSTSHALSTNYRCPLPVVSGASNLLSRNRFRVKKEILAGPSAIEESDSLSIRSATSPTTATASSVEALIAAGAPPKSIIVLARVNALLAPVEVALSERGIAVSKRDEGGFVNRAGVRAARAWFHLAISEDLSRDAVKEAARKPGRGLSPRVIDWMAEQDDVRGLKRLAGRINNEKDAAKVLAFASDLEALRRKASSPSGVILEAIRTELGLESSMGVLDSHHMGRNSSAHSDDLRALVALGELHPDPTTFLAWLRRAFDAPNDPNGVTVATVHKVKGLEWDHVIIHDASDGIFPYRLSTDPEEERRVFHVAITRAKRSLTIVHEAGRPSLLIDELAAAGAPPPLPTSKTERSTAVSQRPSATPSAMPGEVGLNFVWGGYECRVVEITASGAKVSIGSSTTEIPFDSEITVDGSVTRLGPPGPSKKKPSRSSSTSADFDEAVFEALKAWRLERCRADGVPAYVVLANKALEAVAVAMPTDERSLLSVPGIGPAKLELYGDEILAVLDQHR